MIQGVLISALLSWWKLLGGHIELPEDNISILDDISFALLTVFTSSLNLCHTLFPARELFVVIETTDFSLDESSLKIRVNDSSGLWGKRSLDKRPASNFLFTFKLEKMKTGSEIVLKRQFLVTSLDDLWQRRDGTNFFQPFGLSRKIGSLFPKARQIRRGIETYACSNSTEKGKIEPPPFSLI